MHSLRPALFLCTGLLWLLASASASVAGAQEIDESKEAEAKAMFEAGRTAFDAGRYDDALQRWEVAFRLSGRPAVRYNLGLAHERLGQIDEAIAAFDNYLKWDSDGQRAAEVRGKLQTLRSMRGASERPHQHSRAAAPPPAASSAPVEPAPAPEPQPVAESPVLDVEPASPPGSGVTVLGWVLVGGGAAMLAGSLLTGAAALAAEDDLETGCTDRVCAQTLSETADDANTYALITDVLWIGGAVIAGTGITLLLLDDGEPDQLSARLRLAPGALVIEGTL